MLRIFALIALMAVWLPVVQAQQPASPSSSDMASVWTDPATGLMWTKKDNGLDVTWNQASAYCTNLRLVGNSGWRLPSIDELAGIYDQTQNVDGRHIKGGIQISGWWGWSNTAGNASGEAWIFYFALGERGSFQLDFSTDSRALCVRRSGK